MSRAKLETDGPGRQSVAREVLRLRESVALTECDHVTALRLSGPRAGQVVSDICPLDLYVQDGQMLHTLLLDALALPVADLYVCAEGEDFILLVEGLDARELGAYLETWSSAARDVERTDLGESHRHVSLDGPYAWELLSELLGPEIIGLPYLGFYQASLPGSAGRSRCLCFRAGKTGEYGYGLWFERGSGEWFERLLEIGQSFDLGRASLAALDTCALENWFFNIRREGRFGLSPLELQLQWRISRGKSHPGSERLVELRRQGVRERAVLIACEVELERGDAIELCGMSVGEVLDMEPSPTRGDWLGIARIAVPYSHPGLGVLRVGSEQTPARVISAPAVDNRSLYVDPQRHSYHTREQHPPPWRVTVPR